MKASVFLTDIFQKVIKNTFELRLHGGSMNWDPYAIHHTLRNFDLTL